jgi:hypothetical protein
MNREQALRTLTANCRCEEDRAALNGLSDPLLLALARNAKAEGSNADEHGEDDGEGEQAGGEEAARAGTSADDYESEDEFTDKVHIKAPKTMNQLLRNASAADREVWANAVEINRQAKLAVVRQLVANIGDPERRKARGTKLMAKSLGELRELAEMLGPTANAAPADEFAAAFGPANYLGAGGGPVGNGAGDSAADDLLDLPVMNFRDDPRAARPASGEAAD